MKANKKHIRISQGWTTKVYRFYNDTHCLRVEVFHHEVKPIIFRTLKWDGKYIYPKNGTTVALPLGKADEKVKHLVGVDFAHTNPEDTYRDDFGGITTSGIYVGEAYV